MICQPESQSISGFIVHLFLVNNTGLFDLETGEKIEKKASGVEVKSILFDLFLTDRRLVLVSARGDAGAPVEVRLESVHSVRSEEHDAGAGIVIALSSSEGKRRGLMRITFKTTGGLSREREREIWIRDLSAHLSSGSGSELKADNILVKSVEFTATLTSDSIVLRPNESEGPASVVFARSAVTSAASGQNPAGEPTLTISLLQPGGHEGSMVMSFSEWYNGGRAAERDRWVTALGGQVTFTPSEEDFRGTRAGVATPTLSASSVCTSCGAGLPENAKFCLNCGARQDMEPQMQISEPVRRPSAPAMSMPALPDLEIMDQLTGFLMFPGKAFRRYGDEREPLPLPFFIAVLALFAAGSMLSIYILSKVLDPAVYPVITSIGGNPVEAIIYGIMLMLTTAIGLVLISILMWVGVVLAGGRPDTERCLRIGMYSAAPYAVAGLIPVLGGIIAPLWWAVIGVTGLRESGLLQKQGAVCAVGFPYFIILILFALLGVLGV